LCAGELAVKRKLVARKMHPFLLNNSSNWKLAEISWRIFIPNNSLVQQHLLQKKYIREETICLSSWSIARKRKNQAGKRCKKNHKP